jgi:hypothetical protein
VNSNYDMCVYTELLMVERHLLALHATASALSTDFMI